MKRLQNKTAVLTGANKGIGLAILNKLTEEGANVIACSSRKSEEREMLFAAIAAKNGAEVIPIYFDMSDEESVKAGIKEIKDLKQPIDILVNNAGVGKMAILAFTKMSDVHRVFQINYFSPLMIIQSLVGIMKKSETPSIINMSSVAGLDGGVGVSIYGATKASIALTTKVLAQEFSQMKIRVNAVAPGMIETDMADDMGEKAKEAMVAASASRRLGTAEEVANLVAFLASEDSSYINGQIIRVDGGL